MRDSHVREGEDVDLAIDYRPLPKCMMFAKRVEIEAVLAFREGKDLQ